MAELHVSKKNISKLLTEMQGRKFIIPDFQRPYKWDIEKCETLWNDIEILRLLRLNQVQIIFWEPLFHTMMKRIRIWKLLMDNRG